MTATPKVWISCALSRSVKFPIQENTFEDDIEAAIRASEAAVHGDLPDVGDLPEYLFFDARPSRGYKPPPAIWRSYWVFEEAVADVILSFNPGPHVTKPIRVRRTDKVTEIDKNYRLISLGATCELVVPDETTIFSKPRQIFPIGPYAGTIETTDTVQVKRGCVPDADIWIDPKMSSRWFFVSQRLRDALEDRCPGAKLDLMPCREVWRPARRSPSIRRIC